MSYQKDLESNLFCHISSSFYISKMARKILDSFIKLMYLETIILIN